MEYKSDSTKCDADNGDMYRYLRHFDVQMDGLRVDSDVDTFFVVSNYVLDM